MSLVFNNYAKYYDLLYSDKDYKAESEYVSFNISKYREGFKRILELGCGTASHAEYLARLGYTVHGVDQSENMISLAEKRKSTLPPEIAARLSFSVGDVRTVRIDADFDVVISLFHVMSYQTENIDLKSVFGTASAHLRQDGLFLFDFWNGSAVLVQKPEVRVKRLEDDTIKVVRIAEPFIHYNENIVDVNYTVFIEEKKTEKWVQVKEIHKMRYLFLQELRVIQEDFFKEISNCSWMSNTTLNEKSWSGFQILSRK